MRFKNYICEQEEPTEEMKRFYEERTKNHIKRVQSNINKIVKNFPELNRNELLKRAKDHDKSKYSKEERIPYIWLTWWHKENNDGKKFEYPESIKEKVRKATKHHIKANRHHTQFYNNLNDMTDVDIAEMVADWGAMSQELGNKTKNWADKKVGKEWKFNKKQVKLIYDLINVLE